MACNHQKSLLNEYHMLELRNNFLEEENKYLKYEYQLLQSRNQTLNNKLAQQQQIIEKRFEKEKEDYQKIIDNKDLEIARLKSLLNNDSSNCGLPTSKTPLWKNKAIPNSRNKSSKSIGGQHGHQKNKLYKFNDNEINDINYIELDNCPHCHGELIETGNTIDKDVLDYKLVVVKQRKKFKEYKCVNCNQKVHAKIPNDLKEENQYGPNIKALILDLLNEGYISINRVKKIISGLTNNQINLSEGYISKIQKNSSKNLENFLNELKLEILKQKILYWDDTVVYINKKQSCLRFYGNEKLALFKAHKHKNKEGIDEDGILNSISENTMVMHDHNKINYNNNYTFSNIECNAHLQRDLQKVVDNLNHEWAKELKKLITEGIDIRNKSLEKNEGTNEKFCQTFFNQFEEIMLKGIEENKQAKDKYYVDTEKTLITRILDYKNNYFAWVTDFKIPTTNNLSERSLRSSKTKMKISGQFQNIERAQDYSRIKSYIETVYRNNVNVYEALLRLVMEEPFSLDEIKSENK